MKASLSLCDCLLVWLLFFECCCLFAVFVCGSLFVCILMCLVFGSCLCVCV